MLSYVPSVGRELVVSFWQRRVEDEIVKIGDREVNSIPAALRAS